MPDVGCTLFGSGQFKRIFAVEAAGAVQNSRVQAFRMVGGRDDNDTRIGRKAVQLVEEERAVYRVR